MIMPVREPLSAIAKRATGSLYASQRRIFLAHASASRT